MDDVAIFGRQMVMLTMHDHDWKAKHIVMGKRLLVSIRRQ